MPVHHKIRDKYEEVRTCAEYQKMAAKCAKEALAVKRAEAKPTVNAQSLAKAQRRQANALNRYCSILLGGVFYSNAEPS